jgi:hypothetical protein
MKVEGRFLKSVKELRDYLDEVESQWTDKEEEFFGDFEQQSLWRLFDVGCGIHPLN